MLKAVQQSKLIDEDSPQSKSLGIGQPFGRYLTMRVENAFEMLIEVLNGCMTQLVKDASDLFAIIRVGIWPILWSDKESFLRLPSFSHVGGVIVQVPQQVACLRWWFRDEI